MSYLWIVQTVREKDKLLIESPKLNHTNKVNETNSLSFEKGKKELFKQINTLNLSLARTKQENKQLKQELNVAKETMKQMTIGAKTE